MNNYRLEMVKRKEARTGNDLDCLHVMIDNNSNRQIADVYIPLDDVLRAIREPAQESEQAHGRETQ